MPTNMGIPPVRGYEPDNEEGNAFYYKTQLRLFQDTHNFNLLIEFMFTKFM